MLTLNSATEKPEKSKFSSKKERITNTTIKATLNNFKKIDSLEDFSNIQKAMFNIITKKIIPLFNEDENDIKLYFIEGKFNLVESKIKNYYTYLI